MLTTAELKPQTHNLWNNRWIYVGRIRGKQTFCWLFTPHSVRNSDRRDAAEGQEIIAKRRIAIGFEQFRLLF